jgi:hypothetical protein
MPYPPLSVPAEVFTEVLSKSDAQISTETAYKWAARSVVAYREFAKTGEMEWYRRAEDYRHEALEHASLVGDGGELVCHLSLPLDAMRKAVPVPHSCCVCPRT